MDLVKKKTNKLNLLFLSLEPNLNIKESYKLSFDILKLLLGVELDQKLNLSDSLEYLTIKNLNYESTDSNYSNNIDIRLAENKVIEEKFYFD